jgi:Uma2 family endonuclease
MPTTILKQPIICDCSWATALKFGIQAHHSEPIPDIAIVQPLGALYLDHHPYSENIFWLIEFAKTTLKKDLGAKKELYATVGIPEYWVVDLQDSQLHVFWNLLDNKYQQELVLTGGFIQPQSFPGSMVDVQRFLN